MKILITGGNGQLGTEIFSCFENKKTEISSGGYKDGRKNLSRWINGF